MGSKTLEVRLSPLRTCATTPNFSQVAPYGGRAKSKIKGKGAPLLNDVEEKVDILFHDLWTQGVVSIYDMHVVNTYAISYQYKIPEKLLEISEREKKNRYLHYCLNKRQHCIPFVNQGICVIIISPFNILNIGDILFQQPDRPTR